MSSRNPYDPPSSTVAVEEAVTRSPRGTARGAALKAMLGSGLAAAFGFGAGIFASGLYARHYYPDDPDPVDFTIGAIFLFVSAGIWLAGTILAVWLAFRRPRASTA